MKRKREVLLIDGNSDNCLLMKEYLALLGIKTVIKQYGIEGLKYVNTAREITDVIIDTCLPDISGFLLYRQIRNMRSDVSVIITTADLRKETSQIISWYGIRKVLIKPYNLNDLEKIFLLEDRSVINKYVCGNALCGSKTAKRISDAARE